MTVIVYRDGVMAGDTLVTTERGLRAGYGPKIIRTPSGSLVGVCGTASACATFLKWAGERVRKADVGIGDDEDFEAIVVFPDGRVGYFDPTGVPDFLTAEFHAIGNAREFAIGAMAMGATAEQAVKVAIAHNVHCGGEVTVLRLRVRDHLIRSKVRSRRA